MKTKWDIDFVEDLRPEFEPDAHGVYIQRRNFSKLEEDGYSCEMRFISEDVYQEIIDQREDIKKVVLETTNTAAYEDGYKAAMILLGGEE